MLYFHWPLVVDDFISSFGGCSACLFNEGRPEFALHPSPLDFDQNVRVAGIEVAQLDVSEGAWIDSLSPGSIGDEYGSSSDDDLDESQTWFSDDDLSSDEEQSAGEYDSFGVGR